MNSGLSVVIAAEFFGGKTLLLVTLYQIITNVALVVLGYIVHKYVLGKRNTLKKRKL